MEPYFKTLSPSLVTRWIYTLEVVSEIKSQPRTTCSVCWMFLRHSNYSRHIIVTIIVTLTLLFVSARSNITWVNWSKFVSTVPKLSLQSSASSYFPSSNDGTVQLLTWNHVLLSIILPSICCFNFASLSFLPSFSHLQVLYLAHSRLVAGMTASLPVIELRSWNRAEQPPGENAT